VFLDILFMYFCVRQGISIVGMILCGFKNKAVGVRGYLPVFRWIRLLCY